MTNVSVAGVRVLLTAIGVQKSPTLEELSQNVSKD
jgi:hypothetical protein